MSMVGEQSVWLRAVTRPGATVFGLMFALESLARAILAALIPLQAYKILKEARDVSLTYFAVSIFGFRQLRHSVFHPPIPPPLGRYRQRGDADRLGRLSPHLYPFRPARRDAAALPGRSRPQHHPQPLCA
jgi:hypothetical protein